MQFQGAVIEEQGVTFGILIVKPHVLNDATRRDALVSEGSRLFGGIPTVLMAQASNGRPRYYGRFRHFKVYGRCTYRSHPLEEIYYQ